MGGSLSGEELCAALDQIGVACCLADGGGRVLSFNSSFSSLPGLSLEGLPPGAPPDRSSLEPLSRAIQVHLPAMPGRPSTHRIAVPLSGRSSQSLIIDIRPVPKGSGGEAVYAVLVLPSEAADSSENHTDDFSPHEPEHPPSAQSDLLAVLFHELVTPPVVIHGYIELLLRGRYGLLSAEMEKPVRTVQRNIATLSAMVEAFLDLSRLLRSQEQEGRREVYLEDAWNHLLTSWEETGLVPRGRFLARTSHSHLHVVSSEPLAAYVLEILALNALDMAAPSAVITADFGAQGEAAAWSLTIPERRRDAPPLVRYLERFVPEPSRMPGLQTPSFHLGLPAAKMAAQRLDAEIQGLELEGGAVRLDLCLPVSRCGQAAPLSGFMRQGPAQE
ncbi:MAG: histidine kinase dimerization/phospho-acceptor domain-containing protein [Acidobacteriota bacterium]